MFEIMMLLGFFAIGFAHLLPAPGPTQRAGANAAKMTRRPVVCCEPRAHRPARERRENRSSAEAAPNRRHRAP